VPPRGHEPVRVSGKIRHRALYLYGIEFMSEVRSDPGITSPPLLQRSSQ
jgi:hypothetical protein